MKKIKFEDLPSENTPINSANLDTLQNNIEESAVIVSSTEPQTKEKVWFQKGKNLFDVGKDINDFFQTAEDGSKIDNINNTTTKINIANNRCTILSYDRNGYKWLSKWINLEKNKNYKIKGRATQNFSVYGFNSKNIGTKGTKITTLTENNFFNSENYNYYAISFYPSAPNNYFENILIGLNTPNKIYTKNSNGTFEEFYNEEDVKIETMTNGNGTAMKFANGTLIQYGSVNIKWNCNEGPYNGWYYHDKYPIKLPMKFINNLYSVSITKTGLNVPGMYVYGYENTNTEIKFSLACTYETGEKANDFEYIAIGRWK